MTRLITLHQPIQPRRDESFVAPVLVNVDALKTIEPIGKMDAQPGYDWSQIKSILNFYPGWMPVMETIEEIKLIIESGD